MCQDCTKKPWPTQSGLSKGGGGSVRHNGTGLFIDPTCLQTLLVSWGGGGGGGSSLASYEAKSPCTSEGAAGREEGIRDILSDINLHKGGKHLPKHRHFRTKLIPHTRNLCPDRS